MINKLGSYITKLMTIVLDKEQEQFVKDLALREIEKLNVDVNDFIRKNKEDVFDRAKKEKQEKDKQLLQEDKNVKDK
tara:strand:+ start:442 stop:672 length:231 start_codon:yes stop_codon:yes gene_type:complete